MSLYSLIRRTLSLRNHSKIKMDMLSLCRKRVPSSPDARRRSPRIAEQTVASYSSNTKQAAGGEDVKDNDKRFSNIDYSSLPAVLQRPNGNIIIKIMAKPGAKQSMITGGYVWKKPTNILGLKRGGTLCDLFWPQLIDIAKKGHDILDNYIFRSVLLLIWKCVAGVKVFECTKCARFLPSHMHVCLSSFLLQVVKNICTSTSSKVLLTTQMIHAN